MVQLRSTQIVRFGSGSGDEGDIDIAARARVSCGRSVARGSADRDAEGPKKVVAGVSIRRECLRGEGERQSSGLPVSRGA
jgi:hypothetical protein